VISHCINNLRHFESDIKVRPATVVSGELKNVWVMGSGYATKYKEWQSNKTDQITIRLIERQGTAHVGL